LAGKPAQNHDRIMTFGSNGSQFHKVRRSLQHVLHMHSIITKLINDLYDGKIRDLKGW